MQLFSCPSCGQQLFFENTRCTKCGEALAYLPDRGRFGVVTAAAGDELHARAAGEDEGIYRRCKNDVDHAACNWAVPVDDKDPFCWSCRLNGVIPNLSDEHAKLGWLKIERAKRRLVYTLHALGLPVVGKHVDPERGLGFAFLRPEPDQPVTTGHADGIITLNVDEADDPFREQVRVQLGETYRTLLGHLRHEVGHYYWQRLVADSADLEGFRACFGDERADYAAALKQHYDAGAAADWPQRFVSAYASAHPWEDWAETWAHYLHIVDTLETARGYGLSLAPRAVDGPLLPSRLVARRVDAHDFDALIAGWVPLTVALNSLNRSMGLRDAYPFVLSQPAIDKLRFVHDVIGRVR